MSSVFTKVPDVNYVEAAPPVNPEEFERIVQSRRSVRVYTDEPIPESVMRQCLELALLAPNSSNLQPWEFYWVRSEVKKQELVRLCMSQPAAATAKELVVCVARLDTWWRNRRMMIETLRESPSGVPDVALQYYERLVPLAYGQGPLYICGFFKKWLIRLASCFVPMATAPGGKADMRVWSHKTTALACENLMLALRAHGFDTCAIEGMDAGRVRRLLRLPRGAEICMIVAAGKRAANGVYGAQIRLNDNHFLFEV